MKACLFCILLLVCIVSSAVFAENQVDIVATQAPAAVIPESIYTFGTVPEGKTVTHSFVVQNTGAAPLQILEVKTTCGCTTADYSKEIPPGGEGTVTLRLNTGGYSDQDITKSATVTTNDPASPTFTLQMKGRVDLFARIAPSSVRLEGAPGEAVRSVVEVVPGDRHPFQIIGEPTVPGKHVGCGLERREGKYLLTIENLTKEEGSYFDSVILKTDNADNPEIKILVFGRFKPAVQQEVTQP